MTAIDRDGVGFAAMSKTGIWGERWFDPATAWSKESRKTHTKRDEELEKKYKGAIQLDKNHNSFGAEHAFKDDTTAVIYHSRMATCEKNLDNVHPFVRENTALIHNGVIANHEEFEKVVSTCDSEAILSQYQKLDVTHKPDAIETVAQSLSGSYACAVLTVDKDKKRYLDLFRNRNMVWAVFVDQLDTLVFCTSDDIIKAACKELGWTTSASFKFADDKLLRFDCDTGEVVHYKGYSFFHKWNNQNYNNPYYNEDYWENKHKHTNNTTSSSVGASDAGKNSTISSESGSGDMAASDALVAAEAAAAKVEDTEKKSHLTIVKKSEAV